MRLIAVTIAASLVTIANINAAPLPIPKDLTGRFAVVANLENLQRDVIDVRGGVLIRKSGALKGTGQIHGPAFDSPYTPIAIKGKVRRVGSSVVVQFKAGQSKFTLRYRVTSIGRSEFISCKGKLGSYSTTSNVLSAF